MSVKNKSRHNQHSNLIRIPSQHTKPKHKSLRFFHIPIFIVTFMLLWSFCSIVYGEIFYLSEQFSYFAFDKCLMQDIIDLWYGPIVLVGRFFLLSFKNIYAGGFILAFMLTVFTWLLDYCLNLKKKWKILTILPAYGFIAFLTNQGLNIFYEHEPAQIFMFPFLGLVGIGIATLIIRIKTKRPISSLISPQKNIGAKYQWAEVGLSLIFFILLCIFVNTKQQNALITATMQHQMQEQKWDDMIETAKKAKHPSRPVCAYYAIALEQTDQLITKMFDIFYQYPNIHLKNKTLIEDSGTYYYSGDCNFIAGLINSAYHFNMEQSVMGGLTIYRIKSMILCTIITHENNLAEKYMDILEKTPFERDFIEKYRPMIFKHSLIKTDPMLVKIMDVMPVENAFEQQFTTPTFLGYNVGLLRGRSIHALYNCLASCLYTKNIGGFLKRIGVLSQQEIMSNNYFQEVLILNAVRNIRKMDLSQFDPYILNSIRQLLNDAAMFKGKDSKFKGEALKNNYIGRYSFYYFYQNIPDDNYASVKRTRMGAKVN